jgi:hypothetical protein
MVRNLSSLIIAAIVTSLIGASSAHASTCPTGIEALQKESDALGLRFTTADAAKNPSARPSEEDAKELIACLQPLADSDSEPNRDRATAYMELSCLWGYILSDYSSSLGDKKISGVTSWKDIKEAVALDSQSQANYEVLAKGVMGMRKQSGLDKMVIQKNLGINLNDEKNECVEKMENMSLTPAGQEILDQLKKS